VSDNKQSGFHNQRTSQKRGESEKCISPWFYCPLSGGWRPTLYFTVFWAVGHRPTPSSEWFLKGPRLISPFTQWAACSPHLLLSDSSKARALFHRSLRGLPAAHTFFWVIPTTPTPKWRWFHRVRCGWQPPHAQHGLAHPRDGHFVCLFVGKTATLVTLPRRGERIRVVCSIGVTVKFPARWHLRNRCGVIRMHT